MKTPHPDQRRPFQRTSLGHGCRYDGRPLTKVWNVYGPRDSWKHAGRLRAVTRAEAREEWTRDHPGTVGTDWTITRERSY